MSATAHRASSTVSLPALAALLAIGACDRATTDPFPEPIEASEGVIEVSYEAFAILPDIEGEPARAMTLAWEPGAGRYFVTDMRGLLYVIDPDGGPAEPYLDLRDPAWGVDVQSEGRERGVQSFALHPRFAEPGAPGYGRFYTWTDSRAANRAPDFRPGGGEASHHTVLHEWRTPDPSVPGYTGGPPRELLRLEQPYGNHNGGHIGFNPLAEPGDADFGLLYVGVADGGSGGDPLGLARDAAAPFGKILRIDPLGSDGPTGEYGIPAGNPFADESGALGEVYAYGVRNPQHLAWDAVTGTLFVADIGQNAVEEVSIVEAGADLGWSEWEGSFRFIDRTGVSTRGPRADPDVTYPVVEYDQRDPLVGGRVAVTGLVAYRSDAVPQLTGRLLFGDLPSGELFHVPLDSLPDGGQDAIRRVLLRTGDGEPRTFLEVIRAETEAQGRRAATRADLRLDTGPDGRIFLLNKHDGVIRRLLP